MIGFPCASLVLESVGQSIAERFDQPARMFKIEAGLPCK
jgi:hypothetical protein